MAMASTDEAAVGFCAGFAVGLCAGFTAIGATAGSATWIMAHTVGIFAGTAENRASAGKAPSAHDAATAAAGQRVGSIRCD